MDALTFILQIILWQLIHFSSKSLLHRLLTHHRAQHFIPSKTARTLLIEQYPAYLVSTLHALFVTPRGLQHIVRLFNAPVAIKLLLPRHQVPPEHISFANESTRVLFTNATLAGYLITDLGHVLYHYPKLGSWDTVLHHIAFFTCAFISGWYGMYPFMFGWLIIGEASTPLLNLRWFLIKAGKGSTSYFRLVELAFVAVFILTRFFIYGVGLAHQLAIIGQLVGKVPMWALLSTMSGVCAGFLLNLLWIGKMYKLAKGGGAKNKSQQTQQTQQTQQSATTDGALAGTDSVQEGVTASRVKAE